ncbi:prepilin-type N-terminal cleavage/methylation domain-containing protein [Acinetobacter johnsonii]|uniref:prepilin-type N-terminal cleavage/methylation domain-containing protein n=1 Tax=Acinetobacter johnsonii TaxID=40214 RepID=UPI001F4153FA|nr:prepilin-type N-terminal cleavage/methylation domain-containing protein [Acinetobacter johnsonii]UJA03130.1 prepilin-type N-terminal cleavage/methylation domain-containing protein [Acinetobacter johnsonii]
MKIQKGFTLIELMIALALGLIVVAAAAMLFLTGVKSSQVQQGMADLQDNANFGLNYITQDLRLANLNTVEAAMNDVLLHGGVVLSQSNLPTRIQADVGDVLLSRSNGDAVGSDNEWTGASNVTQNSDQLVIQYKPAQTGGFDCEGREITTVDRIVIQRYFLRIDANAGAGEGNPLALACDAGDYDDNDLTRYGDAGEIIMKRVDHFRVLLNVSNAAGNRRYIGIHEYMALTGTKPRILGVSLGVLARSGQSTGQEASTAQNNAFVVLDQDVAIGENGNPQGFIRQVVTQEVAIRNALGERE